MSHLVIGTAGHVDHGKTSLVRALTGVDCDRLPEEKRRGITIDLGFAKWDLGARTASIVDVPGHERFVQTMVAGAAGVDVVLMVIAADDGIMPQTREHLAICAELGVEHGVFAITKCDLADDEMLELVEDEARSLARGTFLEGAPIVRCSVADGRGMRELAETVSAIRARARPAGGPPWLSIDRVFVKRGFGTIVTGTLVRGSIATGDTLEIVGRGEVSVRGLSVHEREVERATAATRLAINLRTERANVERGDVLTAPGWQRLTTAVDVELHAHREISPRTELMLSIGTAHVPVRARAKDGLVRLSAKRPFAAYAGQRFVLRRPELGSDRTIGGGEIADPHPFRRARVPVDRERRLASMIDARPGITTDDLCARLPPDHPISGIAIGDRWFAPSHLERAKERVLAALEAFHRDHPALGGAAPAELEGALPRSLRPLVGHAVEALIDARAIVGRDRVRLPAHDARGACDRVAEIYRAAGLAPGNEDAVCAEAGIEARTLRDVVGQLVREKRLVRVSGLYFHADALKELRARVRGYLEANDAMTPGDFKALTGLTRKHAIALLEWLDAQGVTRRRGDRRVRA